MNNHKVSTQHIGARAEQNAQAYLQSHGLSLITKNFRCKYGEIDLIMQTHEPSPEASIVFVEVRFRKLVNYGHGVETVSHSKKQRLIRTALYYLQENHLFDKVPCRFDVLGASGDAPVVWIKNAFEVDY